MNFSNILRHPYLVLILSSCVFLGFASFAPFVQTVNNVDYFTLKDSKDKQFYEEFKALFGNDEFFIIAFKKENLFTTKNLKNIKEITQELQSLRQVRDVLSLANVDNIFGTEKTFGVEPLLSHIPEDRQRLSDLQREALSNPLYVGNVVSADGKTAAIIVFPHDRADGQDFRKQLLQKTKKILAPYQDHTEFHLSGWTVTNLALSQYMKRDLSRFIPVTYVMILLVVFLFFRDWRHVLLAFINITACTGSTMGLFWITGITLNNVTCIVPPLVMALSLADTVHIFSRMDISILHEHGDARQALAAVLHSVFLPCLLTTLTTAIGFLSLAISDLPPIEEFAAMASAGMIFEFFFSFLLLPPLILFFRQEKLYRSVQSTRFIDSLLAGISRMVRTYAKTISFVFCLLVIGALGLASQVKTETNLLEFFLKSSPIRQNLQFVENNLGGTAALEISLQADSNGAFKEPDNLRLIEQLEHRVAALPSVDKTLSMNTFLKDMNKAFHADKAEHYRLPDSRQAVAQYLLLFDVDDIDDFVNSEYDHARITARISEHGSAAQAELINKVNTIIQEVSHPGMAMQVTGRVLQDVNTIGALVSGQIKSLAVAGVVITITMVLVLKSLTIGLLSLIPNSFPIILNFGIMGALAIPLNTATALIAAVALGIAVDDSIHFLSHYGSLRKGNVLRDPAVQKTITEKGRAIISTSIILCIGFGIMMLSSFVPVIQFGFLSSLIMLTAMIGDMLLLPALIVLNRN